MLTRPFARASVVALVVVAGATALPAQTAAAIAIGGLDQLTSRFESVSIFGGRHIGRSAGPAAADAAPWNREYGLEFGFHLSGRGSRTVLPWVSGDTVKAGTDKAKFDVTKVVVRKHPHAIDDSVYVLAPIKPDPPTQLFEFDLGLGYGQLDGVDVATPYEFHGNVRELPSISTYVAVNLTSFFSIYTGGRTGLLTLQDGQIYFPRGVLDTTASVSASTFEYGIPLGVDLQWGDAHMFFEYSWTHRRFASLTYSPANPLPHDAPHALDLSGKSFDIGLTFPIPPLKK